MKINLTIIFIAVCLVAIFGFAGAVAIIVSGNDPREFYAFLITVLTAVIGFGGTFYGVNKLNEKTDQVRANVNGNLSKLIELATRNAQTRSEMQEVRQAAERTGLETDTVPTV